MAKVYWLDGPAVFRFVGGVWECSFTSGGKEVIIHATPPNLVGSLGNASQAYAEQAAKTGADIVSIVSGGQVARGEAV